VWGWGSYCLFLVVVHGRCSIAWLFALRSSVYILYILVLKFKKKKKDFF
jgi:hypothetical protein